MTDRPLLPVILARRPLLLTLGAGACAIAGLAVGAGCLTTPPPDLSDTCPLKPTIVPGAEVPPPVLLTQWPADFVVPVQFAQCGGEFVWDAFIDNTLALGPEQQAAAVDGGVVILQAPLVDPNTGLPAPLCHTVQILVAHRFDPQSNHTWDSAGGDIVTWQYVPDGCGSYDAGALQDGAFPPEAAADGLPVAPEAGGDP